MPILNQRLSRPSDLACLILGIDGKIFPPVVDVIKLFLEEIKKI